MSLTLGPPVTLRVQFKDTALLVGCASRRELSPARRRGGSTKSLARGGGFSRCPYTAGKEQARRPVPVLSKDTIDGTHPSSFAFQRDPSAVADRLRSATLR